MEAQLEEADLSVYRRSWDAFIDAYGELLEKKEKEPAIVDQFASLITFALAFDERLTKVSSRNIDKKLSEEFNKWLKSLPQQVSPCESE